MSAALSQQLKSIDDSIAMQEKLRGRVPDEQIDAIITILEQQKAALLLQQGDGSTVVAGNDNITTGQRGATVGGDVGGDITTGDHNKKIQTEQYIENYHEADPAQAVDVTALRIAYLGRLLRSSDELSLAGIDPKAASSEQQAQLNLGAVYTALMTSRLEKGGMVELGGMRSGEGRGQQASALSQLNQQHRLVLLGDPGSGKSSFVNFVTLCLAGEWLQRQDVNLKLLTAPLPTADGELEEEVQPWDHGRPLPVRIILRDLAARGLPPVGQKATADHLWAFLQAEPETAAFAPHLPAELRRHDGLILFDGMDEVPAAHERRVQIKQLIEDVADTMPQTRLLITSRTYAYQKQDWQLDGFSEAVLAPFSEGQIRRFIQHWYAHLVAKGRLHQDSADQRIEQLKTAVFNSSRLRELAERPLLLTLMASLHAWRGGSLPEKREELYSDTVDLLLDWWEGPKLITTPDGQTQPQKSLAEWLKVDRDSVRRLLNRLAFEAHAGQADLVGTADIQEETLIKGLIAISKNPDIKPMRLLEYLSDRAGLLLPRGVGVYTFPHRTFQEYLAACHLADLEQLETLTELACADPNRWREVVLLAAAHTERGLKGAVWLFVDHLCGQAAADGCDTATVWGAHLAAQVLTEVANLEQITRANARKVERVIQSLCFIMRSPHLPALERALAGRSLAQLGDPRPEVMTIEGMKLCLVPLGPFWMGSDDVPQDENDNTQAAYESQKPQHQRHLPYDFWISQLPITNAQFEPFVAAKGYEVAEFWPEAIAEEIWKEGQVYGCTWLPDRQEYQRLWRDSPYRYDFPYHLPNHPVVGITWYEALAYTRWLTQQGQAQGWLPAGWHLRLPTEAEWEKAARGGVEIPAAPIVASLHQLSGSANMIMQPNPNPKRVYPWGDDSDIGERANAAAAEIDSSSAVGCFPAGISPVGCAEMSGNVLEWTQTLYGRYDREKSEEAGKAVFDPWYRYPYQPDDGRENLTRDSWWPRVLRGGTWGQEAWQRCAFRSRFDPVNGNNRVGFRTVCVPISLASAASER